MRDMVRSAVGFAQFGQSGIGTLAITGDKDNAGALLRQADGGDFADAGGRAGDDDSFSAHEKGSRR